MTLPRLSGLYIVGPRSGTGSAKPVLGVQRAIQKIYNGMYRLRNEGCNSFGQTATVPGYK